MLLMILRSRSSRASSHEPAAMEHCPAEKWRTRWRCDVCPAAYVTAEVVGSIHLDSRLDEYQTSAAQFWHTDWHHQALAEHGSRAKQTFRCNVFLPGGSGNVQSIILRVLQCSRHIAGLFFKFQQVKAPLINIIWVRLPWFVYNNIWHGSVATYLRCGGTYYDHCFINLMLSLTVKEFWKSATFSWSYGQDLSDVIGKRVHSE